MIRILSFDLDGTLVTNSFADAVWLEGVPRVYAQEKHVSLDEAKQLLFREYDMITDQRQEWYDIAWWFSRFQLTGNWKDLLNHYRSSVRVFPETNTMIKRLSQEYPLIIISNAKKEFIDIQLDESQLSPYFKHVFSSLSDFNQVKKISNVYQKVCDILKIQSGELLHVGDHKDFDMCSPRAIGVNAFYLDRNNTESGPNVIHSLSEIKQILAEVQKK